METQTPTKRMYRSSAAVRYASVLYGLAVPKGDIQKTKDIFAEVPQLREVFINPTIVSGTKMRVIDQIFPESMRNFLKVACRYQRMDFLGEIFAAYDAYCDEQEQVMHAVLTCVEPPSGEQLEKMKAFLCSKYQKSSAQIQVVEDAGLLGGFILSAGNDEYDWSLKGRLTRLEQKITKN